MAKEIKTIKCPQCGSTQKTEIKPDHYRCNNCQTEYFLDNDDVNINYNYNQTTQPAAVTTPVKAIKKIYGVIAIVVVAFWILAAIVGQLTRSKSNTNSTFVSSYETEISWEPYYQGFTKPDNGQPLLVLIGKKRSDGSDVLIGFYDPIKKELVKNEKLETPTGTTGLDVQMRTFSNGEVYIITNKSRIYKVDKAALKATDVSGTLFQNEPQLQAGIASINFVSDLEGDGLNVTTNDGKSLCSYPLANKVYGSRDTLYKKEEGMETLLPGTIEKNIFVFTRKSTDYPDQKIQLLKLAYKDNMGGPKRFPQSLVWSKWSYFDFKKNLAVESKGLFTDRDRIVSYKDMTPDRLYFTSADNSDFTPKVLYSDDSDVLIMFISTPAPNAPVSLQDLDANTGAIKWTTVAPAKTIGNPNNTAIKSKEGFLIMDFWEGLFVDFSGKIVSNYKLN